MNSYYFDDYDEPTVEQKYSWSYHEQIHENLSEWIEASIENHSTNPESLLKELRLILETYNKLVKDLTYV